MTALNAKGALILTDADRFPGNNDEWDEESAKILAKREGIGDLTIDKMERVEQIFLGPGA